MNACNIYVDTQHVYVVANAETTHGFNIATEPMIRVDLSAPARVLGSAVIEALNAYKRGVPVPNLKKVEKAVLSFTGHKSLRTFEQDLSCVFVQIDGEKVRITPTVGGNEGGFLFQQESTIIADFNPESIARAIYRALELPGSRG